MHGVDLKANLQKYPPLPDVEKHVTTENESTASLNSMSMLPFYGFFAGAAQVIGSVAEAVHGDLPAALVHFLEGSSNVGLNGAMTFFLATGQLPAALACYRANVALRALLVAKDIYDLKTSSTKFEEE